MLKLFFLFYKNYSIAFCRFTFVLLVSSRLKWFEMHCCRWITFSSVEFIKVYLSFAYIFLFDTQTRLGNHIYIIVGKRGGKNVFRMDDILTKDFKETYYIKYLLCMMHGSKPLASTHYGINYWFSNATIRDWLVL